LNTRIVFLQQQLETLRHYLFDREGVEGAAFALCGESRGSTTTKLICHAILPIANEDFERRASHGMTIPSRAFTRVAKLARHENLSVIFAHSHPEGVPDFSAQDDEEEKQLIPFLHARVPGRLHGTLVLTRTGICGRIYDGLNREESSVLVVGERFQLWGNSTAGVLPRVFDRQVRAFGSDIQHILGQIHVGIVGLGGTGSPVAEQLTRLGIGRLSLFDGDRLDPTNVNRVYGSSLAQSNEKKVNVAAKNVRNVGLGTELIPVPEHIVYEDAARLLRDCDVVFGCTDRQLPRAILTQLSLRYSLPVIDLGVLIDSEMGHIHGIHGRVTTFLAGEACLFCRGRISPEMIRVEALTPQDRERQAAEGYVPDLEEPAPAVIAFTSAVSSFAVAEFLHRLTGFRGNRNSSEVLIAFDENRIRTNRVESRATCICADEANWGRGDDEPYLGMVWPNRTR
jgi:molybdopterin/thiamine biosynthesis adenylyltransferase